MRAPRRGGGQPTCFGNCRIGSRPAAPEGRGGTRRARGREPRSGCTLSINDHTQRALAFCQLSPCSLHCPPRAPRRTVYSAGHGALLSGDGQGTQKRAGAMPCAGSRQLFSGCKLSDQPSRLHLCTCTHLHPLAPTCIRVHYGPPTPHVLRPPSSVLPRSLLKLSPCTGTAQHHTVVQPKVADTALHCHLLEHGLEPRGANKPLAIPCP